MHCVICRCRRGRRNIKCWSLSANNCAIVLSSSNTILPHSCARRRFCSNMHCDWVKVDCAHRCSQTRINISKCSSGWSWPCSWNHFSYRCFYLNSTDCCISKHIRGSKCQCRSWQCYQLSTRSRRSHRYWVVNLTCGKSKCRSCGQSLCLGHTSHKYQTSLVEATYIDGCDWVCRATLSCAYCYRLSNKTPRVTTALTVSPKSNKLLWRRKCSWC